MVRIPKREEVLTIPNAITAVGGALTWEGSSNIEEPSGLAKVVIGRSLDVLDGVVARKTGQTSDFGALLDAGTDKVLTSKILIEMWRKNAAPKSYLATLALVHSANAGATLCANLNNESESTRPTKSGKYALAIETVSLAAYAGACAAEHSGKSELAKTLRKIGYSAAVASLPFAAHASFEYVKRVRNNSDQK